MGNSNSIMLGLYSMMLCILVNRGGIIQFFWTEQQIKKCVAFGGPETPQKFMRAFCWSNFRVHLGQAQKRKRWEK